MYALRVLESYPEGSQVFERNAKIPHFTNQEGSSFPNPEGSQFTDPKNSIFFNPEGSQPGLPIRTGAKQEKSFFVNPEGSSFHQSGRVFFCQSRRVPGLPIRNVPFCRTERFPILQIRKDTKPERSFFANPEGSQFSRSGGVPCLPSRNGPSFADPEKTQFHRSGRVPLLQIRKDPKFGNPEGTQTVWDLLSCLRGPTFANPEGSQTGRVPISSIRKGPFSPIPKGQKLNSSPTMNVSGNWRCQKNNLYRT